MTSSVTVDKSLTVADVCRLTVVVSSASVVVSALPVVAAHTHLNQKISTVQTRSLLFWNDTLIVLLIYTMPITAGSCDSSTSACCWVGDQSRVLLLSPPPHVAHFLLRIINRSLRQFYIWNQLPAPFAQPFLLSSWFSMSNAQYTPPTPTRLNCRVESRRRRRCVLGLRSCKLSH